MLFLRRFYYDIQTGEQVESYMRQGDIIITTVQDDYNTLQTLQDRTEQNTGLFEWLQPDEDIEQQFATATTISVIDGELHFEGAEIE